MRQATSRPFSCVEAPTSCAIFRALGPNMPSNRTMPKPSFRSWSCRCPIHPITDEIGKCARHHLRALAGSAADCVANVFGEHKTRDIWRSYRSLHRTGAGAGIGLGSHPDRERRDQHRLGLPSRRSYGFFPAASDKTHITQLLGRMVRTPLARRIPGNERLNAVDCLLPSSTRSRLRRLSRPS